MENLNELKQKFIEAIDKICKDYEEKHQSEFKFWAKYKETGELFFITKRTEFALWGKFTGYKVDQFINIVDCLVPTPSEIESHLKKICDEKGFKKGAKYLYSNGAKVNIINEPAFTYFPENDMLGIEGIIPESLDIVYKDGKFAEIIPDKKKLPKTKGEFKIFLKELGGRDDFFNWEYIDDFLNEFES